MNLPKTLYLASMIMMSLNPLAAKAEAPVYEAAPVDDVTVLEVDLGEGEVTIHRSDGDQLEVSGVAGSRSRSLDVTRSGEALRIEQKVSVFPVAFSTTRLSIGVPARFSGRLQVRQATGTLALRDLDVTDVEVRTSAVRIRIDDIRFDRLVVDAGTGTGKHHIALERRCGDMDITTGVWGVDLSLQRVGGDLTLRGGTMSSRITLPADAPVRIVDARGKGEPAPAAEVTYTFLLKKGVGAIDVTRAP